MKKLSNKKSSKKRKSRGTWLRKGILPSTERRGSNYFAQTIKKNRNGRKLLNSLYEASVTLLKNQIKTPLKRNL